MNLNRFIDLIREAVRAESVDATDERLNPNRKITPCPTSEAADDYWKALKKALVEDPLEVRELE